MPHELGPHALAHAPLDLRHHLFCRGHLQSSIFYLSIDVHIVLAIFPMLKLQIAD